MRIVISNQSELPIYAQIKEQIKEQILSGSIASGSVLPSIRQLAKESGVSVITTTRAYRDLEQEGFIASIQGKGSIVLQKDNQLMQEHILSRIEDYFESAIELSRKASISDETLKLTLEELLKLERK